MIDLKDRIILDDGTVICSTLAAMSILYQGNDLTGVILDDPVQAEEFNHATARLDQDFETVYSACGPQYQYVNWYDMWLTPDEYKARDVQAHCLQQCTTDQQRERVLLEMKLFEERNMIPVLRHLMWMVDHMRKHKILYGVGRGSSVSSYVLFLIGINRIDPLKFNLDISEFLK